jgi:hypothetical protein
LFSNSQFLVSGNAGLRLSSRGAIVRTVWTLAAICLVVGCDGRDGIKAVQELCAKEGGLRIFDTVYVDGYLAEEKGTDCIACKEFIGKRKFGYVDFEVPQDRVAGFLVEPGYYRFTLGQVGDRRCAAYEKDRQFQIAKTEWGYQAADCLAIEKLPGKPTGYEMTVSRGPVQISEKLRLWLTEFQVREIESQRVLGQFRNYAYARPSSKFFAELGGGGGANADAECANAGEYITGIAALRERTLHDLSKKVFAN